MLGIRYLKLHGVHWLRLGTLTNRLPNLAYHLRGIWKSHITKDLDWFGITDEIRSVRFLDYTERRRKGCTGWRSRDERSEPCYGPAH